MREKNGAMKVIELSDANQVNEYISAGWTQIGFYVTIEKEINSNVHQAPHYVLGWLADNTTGLPVYPGSVPEKKKRIEFSGFGSNPQSDS